MNKKFTLLELLVVISIIGILVSILLPSLNTAKEKSKVAVCLSTQKQLGFGLSIYAKNNKGFYPIGGGHSSEMSRGPEAIQVASSWLGLGKLYEDEILATPEVFFCPSADLFRYEGTYGWFHKGGWIASSFVYRNSYDNNRAFDQRDDPNLTVVADWFMYNQENRGVNHIELKGTNVMRLDSSARFFRGNFTTLMNIPSTHTDWAGNEQVWIALGK